MKDSLKEEKGMEGEHFGGLMEVGTRVSLSRDFKVEKECYSGMVGIRNLKVFGIMGCLMEREFSISRMVNDMKEHLKKINSMEMEYSTNRIQ